MPYFDFKSPMTDTVLGIVDEDGWCRLVKLERSFLQTCTQIQTEQAESFELSVQTCNSAHLVCSWEKHLSAKLTGLLMLSLALVLPLSVVNVNVFCGHPGVLLTSSRSEHVGIETYSATVEAMQAASVSSRV